MFDLSVRISYIKKKMDIAQEYMKRLATVLLLVPITVFLLNGCTEPPPDGLPGSDSDSNTYHSTGWKDNPQHGSDSSADPQNCKACHGEDLAGGTSGISCAGCHHGWSGTHGEAFAANPDNCKACHGTDFKGGLIAPSCLYCHHYNDWDDTHHGVKYDATSDTCKGCHGADLTGGFSGLSCVGCHDDNLHHTGGEDLCCNTPACHAGGGGGEGCDECHGHDAGFGGATGGKGTFKSHSTHTEDDDSDELKGPNVGCGICHDTNNYPYFNSGTGTVPYDLSETDVCNNCHSPDGDYNGVDSQDSVGAKDNWAEGVYDGAALKANKEKWCVGCHDDEPATSQQGGGGPKAPNIAGDDDDTPTYGFYVSGHGRPPSATRKECLDCHDATVDHIDDDARTYAAASDNYVDGYRLNDSMIIPRDGEASGVSFDLCASCHLYADLIDKDITNFEDGGGAQIHHEWHIGWFNAVICWDSDWDGAADSAMNCTACHNVHGSPMDNGSGGLWANPVMIRHGELISSPGTNDKVPALDFWWKDGVGDFTNTLSDSREGSAMCSAADLTVNHVCSGCHNLRQDYTRDPN